MSDPLICLITAASHAEAEKIATYLVGERLAACVNILPGVRSIYRWRGKIEQAEEVFMIVKTRRDLFAPLRDAVKTLHSYECPAIVGWRIEEGYQPYLDWIGDETRDHSEKEIKNA